MSRDLNTRQAPSFLAHPAAVYSAVGMDGEAGGLSSIRTLIEVKGLSVC